MKELRVALLGTGWIADVHARALSQLEGTRRVCVASRSGDRARSFAAKHGFERGVEGYRAALAEDVDVVIVALPNHEHVGIVEAAARKGKHVICEKPLATSRAEAEAMVTACREAGVMLALAEELCFVPKFVHAREIAMSGKLGKLFQLRQREQHAGPYSPWFFDRALAGGGALLDMGCHGIEICRWLLGRPRATGVYASVRTVTHQSKTALDDHVTLIVDFEGGVEALIEASWSVQGGMVSEVEILGSQGRLVSRLTEETGTRLFLDHPPTAEDDSVGWTFPDPDWLHSNGYPQELRHFLDCVRTGATPEVSGEDGVAQMEIMEAAYASAKTRARVSLPFRPEGVARAVDLWRAAD